MWARRVIGLFEETLEIAGHAPGTRDGRESFLVLPVLCTQDTARLTQIHRVRIALTLLSGDG